MKAPTGFDLDQNFGQVVNGFHRVSFSPLAGFAD